MKSMSLGLKAALRLTLENITPLSKENVSLVDCVDRIAASDLYALVDSPSMDSSRKDGFAVISHEVANATPEKPVPLQLLGSMAAGGEKDIQVKPGTTVRVLTGARIPTGADAVVAEEYAKKGNSDVLVESFAEPKNVLRRGSDVTMGKCILRTGQLISPAMTGLLAAAGHSVVPVFRNPIVGMLGTGDEIVEPGNTLTEGKLYASNIMTLAGWCHRYGMKSRMAIVKDDPEALLCALKNLADETDAVITSGGAWMGDHDLVAHVLEGMGWKKVFHRIRMGPGKAVGFGMLDKKPVFILAGGPPSNLMGFLQIALPGILALSGHKDPGLPRISARLASELAEGESDWTDFFFGTLEWIDGLPDFHPMNKRSRLNSLAKATAVASIPEGKDYLPAGSVISVQWLK
ncbi:molybdopterin molybdochelatase [Syntrophus gentianae]|uniref:Molybdopterin molybdenumtransferase n=2 Tax=Syntrophus gentianae TaxID=43775 RepID=A0A1H7ZNX8_9BACT|nr:molybdopterin molybdochelatase [Syntrophus gentianae]